MVQVLTRQSDDLTARKYWNQLKRRLSKEGSELVTNCHQLKMIAADGKHRLTDVATAETLLRLVQSVPSPKAEPIKLWLAKVGYERMQEMADPALSLGRARQTWQHHGRSDKWIQQRMTGQETRNKLTDYWRGHDIKEGSEFAVPCRGNNKSDNDELVSFTATIVTFKNTFRGRRCLWRSSGSDFMPNRPSALIYCARAAIKNRALLIPATVSSSEPNRCSEAVPRARA